MERTPKWLKMYRNWNKYYPSEKVNHTTCFALFAIHITVILSTQPHVCLNCTKFCKNTRVIMWYSCIIIPVTILLKY